MAVPVRYKLAAAGLGCIVMVTTGCRHRATTTSGPAVSPATPPIRQPQLIQDQVNTGGWEKAWTNLVNDAEQGFTPTLPRLEAVEVELVVGNPSASDELLTLTILDASGRTVSLVSRTVQIEKCDHVLFMIPNGGVGVMPGQTYRLKLSGNTTFGWKYIVDGYQNGAATFNGKPLLADTRSTFLFRTFGAK